MLLYSGLAVVGELASDDAHLYCLLLLIRLHLPFAIWISLVFVGLGDSVWSLPLLFLGCSRSPCRHVALAVRDHLCVLPNGGSSEGQRSCWSVAVDLLGSLQMVGSSVEQSSCCPMWRCSPGGPTNYGFCFLICRGTPGRLSVCLLSCPACFQAMASTALSVVHPR